MNWSDKKVKTKNLLGCFEINSMFRTSVHGFLPDLSRAYIDGSSISRVKLYRNELKGKQKLLRDSGRLELSRVRVTEGKITVNEIQEKSTMFELARASSLGFELSGVNCMFKK